MNRDIHESKGVNVVYDILHIGCNGPITFLRVGKILVMDHDPFSRKRGICLPESSPRNPRSGGGRDKLHYGGKDKSNNGIEKPLVLLESKSMIWIWGRRSRTKQSYHRRRTRFMPLTNPSKSYLNMRYVNNLWL